MDILAGSLLGLYFIELVGFFTISMLVYLRKRTSLYKSFSLFVLLVGLWQLFQFLSQVVSANHSVATILLHISVGLAGPLLVSFVNFARIYSGHSSPNLLYVLVGVLFGCLTFFSEGINKVEINYLGIGVPALDLWYAPLLVFGAASILYGVYSIFLHYRRSRDRNERHRDIILLSTMVLAGGTVLLASFQTSDFSHSLVGQHVLPLACLFAVISFTYVLYKGFFDIHFFVVRAAAYLTTLFILAVIILAPVILVLVYVLDFGYNLGIIILSTLSIVLITYFLQFIRGIFDRLTSRFFFRQFYNPQDVFDQLSSLLARTIDINELLKDSVKILDNALRTDLIKIYVEKHKEDFSSLSLLERLPMHGDQLLNVDDLEQNSAAIKELAAMRVSLVVRLRTAQESIGYITLGRKRSGEVYTLRDVRLLKTVADELALAIQNALRFEEIRDFNKTLQTRIDDATAKLRRSNTKLQQLDEAKDDFISMASHQLRTPLTSVKGYLSMVIEGDAGELQPTQKKLLEEAYAGAQRMVYLIGDFLNVSRMKTGKFMLEYASTNVATLINEEIGQLRATAERRNLHLQYEAPDTFPTARVDETKIRQVIMNLIDNAIYYSTPDSTIKVELFTKDNSIVFRVKDQGIGVPASQQKDLFEKFFRASNARKVRPDGTGIGLFMIKKVVLAHGGTIIFESKENKGSTFGFTLPLGVTAEKLKK